MFSFEIECDPDDRDLLIAELWEHGSAGIVDASYYSSTTLQPNNPTSVWYAGFSQVTGAVAAYTGGPSATYTSTPAATNEILLNPNPIHGNGSSGGGICTFGLFCAAVPGANRGLADVFEVHVDPAGGDLLFRLGGLVVADHGVTEAGEQADAGDGGGEVEPLAHDDLL